MYFLTVFLYNVRTPYLNILCWKWFYFFISYSIPPCLPLNINIKRLNFAVCLINLQSVIQMCLTIAWTHCFLTQGVVAVSVRIIYRSFYGVWYHSRSSGKFLTYSYTWIEIWKNAVLINCQSFRSTDIWRRIELT